MMRALILLLAGLCAFAAHAQETEAPVVPELTVEISPPEALITNGYVQGQIVLKAQLLSRHPFEALEFKVPNLPDADVIELQRPRTRKVAGYGGQAVVFETAIAIMPHASGVLTIPSVTAVGMVAPQPDEELHFDLASDPVDVKIAGVSRHFDNPWWLVSDRVEIEETWSTPPEEIRVGEVVRRTVSVRVWGVNAERLPRLEHSRTRGMRVTLADQQFRTEKKPDGLIGHATFIWELEAKPRPVAFIAPLALDYWHPIEHRARKAGLPALRLEPLPADSEKIAAKLMQEAADKRNRSVVVVAVVLGVLLLPVGLLAGALIHTRLPTRADRRLRAAASRDPSPAGLYRGLGRWFAEAGETMESFDERHGSRLALSAHLFASDHPAGPVRADVVAEALHLSRRSRLRRLSHWVRRL